MLYLFLLFCNPIDTSHLQTSHFGTLVWYPPSPLADNFVQNEFLSSNFPTDLIFGRVAQSASGL
jgi:hypothetical protein